MNKKEVNQFLYRLSDLTKQFMSSRTLLESNLFPVRSYMALGLYNLFENEYDVFKEVANRKSPETLGLECKRINSEINQKTLFSSIVGYLVGREQVIIDGNIDDYGGSEYDANKLMFLLSFWKKFANRYRNDSKMLVDDSDGVISILKKDTIENINNVLEQSDYITIDRIQKLAAIIQSYLYLLNFESRGGVFNHGPYQIDDDFIIIREFIHLRKNTYKTSLDPRPRFDNIAIAIKYDDVAARINEVGTIFFDQINYSDKITGINIFTINNGLNIIDFSLVDNFYTEIKDNIVVLFNNINKWSRKDKIIAGALQYSDLTSYAKTAGIPYKHKLAKRSLTEYLPRMVNTVSHDFMKKFKTSDELFTLIE